MNIFQVLAILWARRWVVVAVALGALIAAAVVVRMLPPRYEATAQVLLNVGDADVVTNAQLPASMMREAVHTHMEALRSPGDASKAAEVLGWDKKPEHIAAFQSATGGSGDIRDWLGSSLLGRITVTRVGASEIVAIKAAAGNPQEAADIANAFVTAHKLRDIQMRVEPAQDILLWYEEQLATLQKNLARAQANRIEIRRAADAKPAEQRIIDDTSSLGKEFANTRLELTQAQVAFEQVKAQQATTHDVLEARKRLRELDEQISLDSATLGPQHRRVKQLHASRRALVKELESTSEQALMTAMTSARDRVTLAERKLADLSKAFDAALDQNDGRAGVNAADREVEAIQAQIKAILERREKMKLGSAVDHSPIAELARAVPSNSPAFPKLGLTIAVAGGLGSAFALVVALLLEMFDRRLRNGHDVRSYLEAPLLATVPKASIRERAAEGNRTGLQLPSIGRAVHAHSEPDGGDHR